MPRKGRLIVFLGPVGVGKSTVIRGLANELRARGFRTYTIFIKAFHGPSYMLWLFIIKLLGLRRGWLAPWYLMIRSGMLRLAKALTLISAYVDALLSLPLKLFWVYMLRALGIYVLSEDYLRSTIFDYIFTICFMGKWNIKPFNFPLRVICALLSAYTPDEVIVLIASDHVLKIRWMLRGYGDPQPKYVRLQRIYFSNNIKNTLIINTDELSVREIVYIIMRKLGLLYS